jgi:hypothetical protein
MDFDATVVFWTLSIALFFILKKVLETGICPSPWVKYLLSYTQWR